jgi:hypothetical protein
VVSDLQCSDGRTAAKACSASKGSVRSVGVQPGTVWVFPGASREPEGASMPRANLLNVALSPVTELMAVQKS